MKKKLIKIFVILILAGLIIYRYFFYVDFSNHCFITIKPSFTELSMTNIKQAIKVLKYGVPDEYDKLCKNINTINPNLSCGGFQGGCYWTNNINPKEIDISTANEDFVGWTAAIIAHETCHAIQFKNGRGLNEAECYGIDDKVLKAIVEF